MEDLQHEIQIFSNKVSSFKDDAYSLQAVYQNAKYVEIISV